MTTFRRSFPLFFAFVAAWLCAPAAQAAQAYVIIDGKSGFVLQERNSKDKRQVGSLTKVATAAVVLDWVDKHNGDLSQKATVPPDAFMGGENLVGFQPGDVVELRDLLCAALIQSDNIAAHTLADHVGRAIAPIVPASGGGHPVATFVSQMNALAKTLGMTRTLFVNPHGSDANVKPVPYSTAADMARLTRYATNKAGFRFYVSQKERQISWQRAGKTQSYILRNTNELLGQDGVEGVKTGRTARAGDCLILSAQREAQVVRHGGDRATVFPRHLIVVLLASPDRFGEGRQTLGLGWQLHEQWAAAGRQVDPKKVL